jgi:ABC-type Fe3+/spermidine/putrescine transport system ATPase subunit
MPNVKISNLVKRFGRVVALDGINLEIKDGEYLAILGPSGCGKTTLINCVTGIVDITEGEVLIDNKNVSGIPIEQRDFAMVFQNVALFPHMDVAQNVSYAPFVADLPKSEQRKVEEEMLLLVDLLEQKDMYPKSLSGGAQQKTAVARALATREKLLILDEPISALDYKVRVSLRYAIQRLVKKLGLTAIHITHDQEEAASVADRILILRAGKVVDLGTPEQLYRFPKTLFTMNFVGESNFLEGLIENVYPKEERIAFRNKIYLKLKSSTLDFEDGESVVVAFRPESVDIRTETTPNSLEGVIMSKQFIGGYNRYTILLQTEDELIADSRKDLKSKDKVFIQLKTKETIMFRSPPFGLKKSIELE